MNEETFKNIYKAVFDDPTDEKYNNEIFDLRWASKEETKERFNKVLLPLMRKAALLDLLGYSFLSADAFNNSFFSQVYPNNEYDYMFYIQCSPDFENIDTYFVLTNKEANEKAKKLALYHLEYQIEIPSALYQYFNEDKYVEDCLKAGRASVIGAIDGEESVVNLSIKGNTYTFYIYQIEKNEK
jgi:hypothetical protein